MKTKPKKTTKTLAQYAQDYDISASTIKRWKAKGAPLDDPEKLKAWAAENRTTPEAFESQPLKAAQIKKLMLECDRLTFRISVDKGKFIPVEEVVADFTAAGAAFVTALDTLRNDLPPLLLGLDEAGMCAVIQRETNKIRQEMADRLSEKKPK